MSALTKLAKGQPCMICIPGVCCWNTETTVAAHWRDSMMTGKGQKAPDILSAWACSECHRCVDSYGVSHCLERDFVRQLHAEGVLRTQYHLIKSGKVRFDV